MKGESERGVFLNDKPSGEVNARREGVIIESERGLRELERKGRLIFGLEDGKLDCLVSPDGNVWNNDALFLLSDGEIGGGNLNPLAVVFLKGEISEVELGGFDR